MEQERVRQRAASAPKAARRTRAAEPVRDDYASHLRSLVPVRGSDPYTFFGGCWLAIYEYIAGFWHFVDLAAVIALGLGVAAFVQRRKGVRFESHVVTAGFVALVLVAYLVAGVREYHRPLPPYEEGHVGLGPMFRALLVPHRGGPFGGM